MTGNLRTTPPLHTQRPVCDGRRIVFRFGVAILVCLTLLLVSTGFALLAEKPQQPMSPALESNRAPYKIAFTPDGKRVLVTEYDEGAVAVIDRASGKVLHHLPTKGEQPTGIAITPDGGLAIVTNSLSGSVAFLDLTTRQTETISLRGMPWDVVLSPDGKRAYVSVSQLDHVAVLDVAARKVVGTIPTGYRPRALAISPDGATLVAANMTAGSVSYLDTSTLTQRAQGRTPAVNLRGVALYRDGLHVFVVGQRAQNERPTETPIGIWSNQAFIQVPNGPRNGVQNLWLDLMGKDVADPDSVVLDPAETRAFVTCSGGHSLNVVPLDGGGDVQTVQNVGVHPRGLTLSPEGGEVWIANMLGNDLAVVDTRTLKVVRRIPLGATPRKDPDLLGRYLFTTATIVKGEQFSCNSCHPDGSMDGISWKFVHVSDALGKEIDRNAKDLRGHIGESAPYRWSGHERNLEGFVEGEVHGLLQGNKLTPAEVRAMAHYIGSLPLPPNPYRAPNGFLTDAAQRGKALFEGSAGCISCHSGSKAGGQRKAWVGTTPDGIELQVPRLQGVYDSAPYLHDGKARTLEEIFTRCNTKQAHGKAHDLSPEEMKDLLRYVREL